MASARARNRRPSVVSIERAYDHSVVIILLGDQQSGKTDILDSYAGVLPIAEDGKKRRAVGVRKKMLTLNDRKIQTRVLDTAGQERYRSLTASYYRGAHGCLIVFDVTQTETFENVHHWHADMKEYSSQDIQCILVGTKCHSAERQVPTERAEKYAESIGIPYVEVCAEQNTNIKEVFELIVENIIEHLVAKPILSDWKPTTIQSESQPKKKKWCMC